MDPLTAAGTFATIVGLLANFKAERSGSDLPDFIEWLKEKHQESIALVISSNTQLEQALSILLATNHDELVSRLKIITDQLAVVAQKVEGFGPLVNLTQSSPNVSPQALSILKQIFESHCDFVMEHKSFAGTNYIFIGAKRGQIEVDEPRFIDEDLESLVIGKYLRVEYTTKGTNKYYITRAGSELGKNT